MDPLTIIGVVASVIKTAVDLGPTVIKGIEDAKPFADAIVRTLTGGEVTPEQLAELEAQIAALSAQLQAPMEGEDDGTV